MPRTKLMQMERMLSLATRFLDEMRSDIQKAIGADSDTPPRLRSVHERAGHATPEYRTLNIPVPDDAGGASPEVLSGMIARYAAEKRPDGLLLALEAEVQRPDHAGPVLIAEVRDRHGTRLFWMQPYTVTRGRVTWSEPDAEGWQDPGDEEMILDAAFARRRGDPGE